MLSVRTKNHAAEKDTRSGIYFFTLEPKSATLERKEACWPKDERPRILDGSMTCRRETRERCQHAYASIEDATEANYNLDRRTRSPAVKRERQGGERTGLIGRDWRTNYSAEEKIAMLPGGTRAGGKEGGGSHAREGTGKIKKQRN